MSRPATAVQTHCRFTQTGFVFSAEELMEWDSMRADWDHISEMRLFHQDLDPFLALWGYIFGLNSFLSYQTAFVFGCNGYLVHNLKIVLLNVMRFVASLTTNDNLQNLLTLPAF